MCVGLFASARNSLSLTPRPDTTWELREGQLKEKAVFEIQDFVFRWVNADTFINFWRKHTKNVHLGATKYLVVVYCVRHRTDQMTFNPHTGFMSLTLKYPHEN